MDQKKIETTILGKLYEAFFHDMSAVNLHTILDELGVKNTLFWNCVDSMSHQGLIETHAAGGCYIIQSIGVIHAEEQNIGAEQVILENKHIRTVALDKLAKVYEENGAYADAHIEPMSQELNIGICKLVTNLHVLADLGYVEPVANGSYKITLRGLDAVNQWRERVGFAGEYEQITNLTPQPRGRALQKLIAKIIEKDGWSQEEGARTSHEEMDVVIHKAREYFLIECKWEKDPIEASVVRELHGKLSNRIGVQGIIISMSGFTRGAVEQAEDYASSRIILFFGKEDIEQLFFQQVSFDELLEMKYKQLVTRRDIIYH